ncbi:MAG: hypothetical protein ABI254_00825, partial [Chthoniobacterales bacterium]
VPFQRITGFDGAEVRACFCPLDKEFLDYTRDMVTLFSKTNPDFLFIDDDVRLENHAPVRWACACPLHVEHFNQHANRHDSREEIFEAMKGDDSLGFTVRKAWQDSGRESILALMRTIREAIDSVDPTIRCGKCVSGSRDHLYLEDIARTLAGGTVPFMRLAGASYMQRGYQYYAPIMTEIIGQKNTLSDDVEILCEGDTCFHTRYHTPIKHLRGYIAGAIMVAGIDTPYTFIPGTVEWIPSDVEAFSRMLKDNVPFFAECKNVYKNTRWLGPSVICTGQWRINRPWNESEIEHDSFREWGGDLCGRLGIPFTVNNFESPVCMLNGYQSVYDLNEEELKTVFSKGVILDGTVALVLCQRGYGKWIGVDVREGDNELRYFYEKFSADTEYNGNMTGKYSYATGSKPERMKWLTPLNDSVRIASSLIGAPWADSPDQNIVAPALTLFENELGGRVAVYAHEISSYMIAAAFLSDIRKEQLIKIMAWTGRQPLPAVTHTGVDTYFQYGYDDVAKEHIAAVFNVGQDDMSPLPIRFDFGKPTAVRKLADNGQWEAVSFEYKDGLTLLNVCVEPMKPLALRVSATE